jgi:ribosomal-protein-alanine N-acetyltransferase
MTHLFDRADRPREQYTLEVRQSNEAAIALYEKYGFRREGYRQAHYRRDDGYVDAILMAFSILVPSD